MNQFASASVLQAARKHGIDESELMRQFDRLQSSYTHRVPEAPCTIGQGIQRLSESEFKKWAQTGADLDSAEVVRFVPASGAASRMFKALVSRNPDAVRQLDERWEEFPFRSIAEATGPCNTPEERLCAIIERLDLPRKPKGALPFHFEQDGVKTAFEAQMIEWDRTLNSNGASLHFTLPAQSISEHFATINSAAASLSLLIEASVQHPSTDTVALDEHGKPFLKSDGSLLFRPGGHGSLLHNLGDIARAHPGALVSIKNIDNVRPIQALEAIVPWKQALIGIAYALVQSRNEALVSLRSGGVEPARNWLRKSISHPAEEISGDVVELSSMLDRPLLVAGMVLNEGEPGGGPFWIRDDRGTLRAQIVESAEMDRENAAVQDCLKRATHFNPVDLVCAMHNVDGQPYKLSEFVDKSRDFIVFKSHGGRPLKGLEHPGLWNGAMGRWNTVFVEVHPSTFAPVKTVFDLLRPAHRSA